MFQLINRRRDNKIAAVAAEANDRLKIYKRINADTKKKTKGIQIKPLQIEDNTKLTKDGINEASGFDPLHAPPDASVRADFDVKRYDTDFPPPDWSGRADFEHKFNSDSDEAMMASINDKRLIRLKYR